MKGALALLVGIKFSAGISDEAEPRLSHPNVTGPNAGVRRMFSIAGAMYPEESEIRMAKFPVELLASRPGLSLRSMRPVG